MHRVADAEGGPPERIVLTRPAHWGPHHRELLDQVASAAGLDAPRTVTEPEAAAHHALSCRLREGEVVAVHDLGGGTFDATVVRRRGAGFEILGRPESIGRLGGVDFDAAILICVDESTDGALTALDPADAPTAPALARLHQDCVLAEEALSLDTETVVAVFLPGRQFEVRLTRSAFEDVVRPAVDATVAALHRTVRSAGLTPADLHSVLLVGGSSRIPLVVERVARELGRPAGPPLVGGARHVPPRDAGGEERRREERCRRGHRRSCGSRPRPAGGAARAAATRCGAGRARPRCPPARPDRPGRHRRGRGRAGPRCGVRALPRAVRTGW